MFCLDPTIEKDTVLLGQFRLSLVLLHRDSRFPWCILVPRLEDVREIHHLGESDRLQLMRESCCVAETMTELFSPDKMNVAVLGNVVPQLHMHHVARYRSDAAWPGPIWGRPGSETYEESVLTERVGRLRSALNGLHGWQSPKEI